MSVQTIKGIVAPIATPLDDELNVDLDSLRRLVRFQLEHGVHAIFPLGTTGEVSYFSSDQRAAVIETVVDEVGGAVPVLAGVIESSAARTIDESRRAIAAGADQLVVTPPFYGDVSDEETLAHFERVASAVSAPVIAYDIPAKTHNKLNSSVVVELAGRGTISGLKDSSGDYRQWRATATALRGTSFSLLTGTEQMVDASILTGATGAVVGLANVDPDGFVDVYDRSVAGDWDGARQAQERLTRLAEIMLLGLRYGLSFDGSIMGAVKTSLVLRGVIRNPITASGTLLPEQAVNRIAEVLEAVDLLGAR